MNIEERIIKTYNNWKVSINEKNELMLFDGVMNYDFMNINGEFDGSASPKVLRDWCYTEGINYIKPPIGVYCLCNTLGLEIIGYTDDQEKIIIRCNDKISKLKLFSNNKGTYFKWGISRIYMNEIVRLM